MLHAQKKEGKKIQKSNFEKSPAEILHKAETGATWSWTVAREGRKGGKTAGGPTKENSFHQCKGFNLK